MPGTFTYTATTNKVVVTGGTSGSPADFASFKAADDAGTGTSLLAATAPGSSVTLTYQVRPVEYRAIPVKFIVASKTAETDYLFITGTDAWGAAQTESIDVSAGNGTYTSTKRWATITNIDCSDNPAGGGTVWADGTIAVTQDIWGVLWKLGTAISDVWKWTCGLYIGDGSTATYFTQRKGVLIADILGGAGGYASGNSRIMLSVQANGVFQLGYSASNHITSDGVLVFGVTVNGSSTPYGVFTVNGGAIKLYGSSFGSHQRDGETAADFNLNFGSATSDTKVWNCSFGGVFCVSECGAADYYNNTYLNAKYGLRGPSSTMTFDRVYVNAGTYAGYFVSGSQAIELWNVYARGCSAGFLTYHVQNTYCGVINADCNTWNHSMIGDTINFKLYRRYSVDINVKDNNGNALAGVTVRMENGSGYYTNDAETRYGFEVTTDSNGDIAQQVVSRSYYASTAPTTEVYLGPWKITLSKAGYKTQVVDSLVLDRALKLTFQMTRIDEPPAPWEA